MSLSLVDSWWDWNSSQYFDCVCGGWRLSWLASNSHRQRVELGFSLDTSGSDQLAYFNLILKTSHDEEFYDINLLDYRTPSGCYQYLQAPERPHQRLQATGWLSCMRFSMRHCCKDVGATITALNCPIWALIRFVLVESSPHDNSVNVVAIGGGGSYYSKPHISTGEGLGAALTTEYVDVWPYPEALATKPCEKVPHRTYSWNWKVSMPTLSMPRVKDYQRAWCSADPSVVNTN